MKNIYRLFFMLIVIVTVSCSKFKEMKQAAEHEAAVKQFPASPDFPMIQLPQGGKPGDGIERPFDVKFGPDGAMYIVDYGVHRITVARIGETRLPFEW